MNDKRIKILLIEDNPGDVRLIREMLSEAKDIPFDLKCADTIQNGLVRLAGGDIDLVLLDLFLPDSQGLDTFVRAGRRAQQVPIVVLTALDDESIAVRAVEAGAQDYLVKDKVNGNALARSIRYALARNRAEEADQLKRLAKTLIKIQEEERKRIARELHDETGQILMTVKLSLEMLARDKIGLETLAQKDLRDTIKLVKRAMRDLHRISSRLRPEVLDELGLISSIEYEIDSMAKRSEIKFEFETKGLKDRLEPQKEIVLYRVVQEALTNVLKHSGATRVKISLTRKADRVLLRINDNGKGFEIAGLSKSRGLGVLGMRERVDLVGGKFKIISAPGEGTLLEAEIYLNPDYL